VHRELLSGQEQVRVDDRGHHERPSEHAARGVEETFVAQERLTTLGDSTLRLGRGFHLTARPYDGDSALLDRFRVTLNFSDRPETLVVPFEAVKTFIDPSVKFGLKFDDQDSDEDDDGPDDDTPGGPPSKGAEVVRLDRFRKG